MSDFATKLQGVLGNAYQIERELALGGLGRLFLAVETGTGRQVSVQALPPDLAARLDTARFRAAVDKVSRLKHPGIYPLLAAGAREDIVYCVWPHPKGESLRYRLVRDGGLGQDESVQVLYDVADALACGHEQGVYHGDLRPDNIYLEEGRAMIAEFGVRSALNSALGAAGGMDERADLHALAVAGQQMLAGRSGVVAQAVSRSLSIDPSEQFPSAEAFRDALGTPPSARRRRVRVRLGVGAVLLVLAVAVVWKQMHGSPGLEANTIAVAPFEVLDPEHHVWREGLVTVLAANFEGAGPIRSVSPTLVVRSWRGRADAGSAAALGRRTGAGLALFGRVVRSGGDTVTVSASLVDVALGTAIADFRLSDPTARLDRLADSLTVLVLRELGRSRPIGAVSRTNLGASSLPALKAFLEGEVHFRRAEWDSAVAGYQRAIRLDTTFALALYRAGIALGWLSTASDSLSTEYLERAAMLNRGLPPRDSMLIVAESLTAALEGGEGDPRYWAQYRRLYATTAEAARRYPHDPEVWYEYGDVRYHHSAFSSLQELRDAFDSSIELDSAFAPAFIHPVELALQLGDPAGARRYLDRYLALRPRDIYADAMRLMRRLLDPRQARSAQTQAILDTASADLLIATIQSFRGWSDTLATAVRLATLLVDGNRAADYDPEAAQAYVPELGVALAYQGRLAAAWQRSGMLVPWLAGAIAWMGSGPRDTVDMLLARSLARDTLFPRAFAVLAAPVWADRGDTVSLLKLARRADSTQRAGSTPAERAFGEAVGEGTRGLIALVRGDTLVAIRALAAMPDTACTRCLLHTLTLARLYDARRMDVEAARLLARDSPGFVFPTDGFWELYRARLAVRRGNQAAAVRSYRFVRDVWQNGDAALQPYVREARNYLGRSRERD